MENLRVKIRHDKKVVIVELLDEEIMDEAVTNDIAESLFSVVADNPPIKMLLNFANVRQLGSSMLSILVMLNRRIEKSGSVLKLCCVKSCLYEILTTTKIDSLFDIYDDEEKALSSFIA